MTDLRKAAEQALEALENIDRWLPTIGQRGLRDYEADAIQALRQALAEDALKTVADIDHSIGLFIDSPNVDPVNMSEECVHKTDKSIHEYVLDCPRCGHCCQKREWVGLTGEEVKYLIRHFDWRAPAEHFVSLIESKLKEKNR